MGYVKNEVNKLPFKKLVNFCFDNNKPGFVSIDGTYYIGLAYPCSDGNYKCYDKSYISVKNNNRRFYD